MVNPDLPLATITEKKGELDLEIVIGRGRGYDTVEERADDRSEIGLIAVDAVYSPVREVGYRVENVRVGDITNYDKLVMDIETDGTMGPEEAVDRSVKILLDHFQLIQNRGASPAPAVEEVLKEAEEADEEKVEEDEPKKKTRKSSKKK